MSQGNKAFVKGVAIAVIGAFVFEFLSDKLKAAKAAQ